MATIFVSEFVPTTLLVPRFLAASVLARVVLHGVRLASASISSGDWAQRDDTILRRIGMSLVLGVFAGYTVWCVIVSVYVFTVVVHEETVEMSYYLPPPQIVSVLGAERVPRASAIQILYI